jgi:hypothetical protein
VHAMHYRVRQYVGVAGANQQRQMRGMRRDFSGRIVDLARYGAQTISYSAPDNFIRRSIMSNG